jgi:hypothetical protein
MFPLAIKDTVFYCFDHEKRWGKKLSGMMKGMKEAIEKKYVSSLQSTMQLESFL